MINDLKYLLNTQLRTDSSKSFVNKKLAIDVVDKIADELASEYNNQRFRNWYCGVIYQFGPGKVYEWQTRARDGKEPAKLFSKYVKDARDYSGSRWAGV